LWLLLGSNKTNS